MYLLTRGDRAFTCEPGDEVHTDLGVIEVPEDVASGDVLETHLGEPFAVRAMRGPDRFDHLERTGAPMLPRDVGLVLGLTGAGAGDRVLDAGTGSGILATALGDVGATVHTYEVDPGFAATARENVERAGVADRVDVRTGDVTEAADDLAAAIQAGETAPYDVLTLDTGDAPAVVERAPALLAPGGYVAAYTPFVEGTRAVHEAAVEAGLAEVRTLETVQREMDFDERGSRPSTAGVGHSGYLTVARSVPDVEE
ncbi:MAG: methyltransferase domain-containing protein [Halobacteriaceae archaeon]